MYLLIHTPTKRILSAQDTHHQVPVGDFHEEEVAGNEPTYDWPNGKATFCLYDGGVIKANSEYKDNSYIEARKATYASIGDQLDMQYHDLVDGTETWKSHVSKVKSDNPKPS